MSKRVYEACDLKAKEDVCDWDACHNSCINDRFFDEAIGKVLAQLRYTGA